MDKDIYEVKIEYYSSQQHSITNFYTYKEALNYAEGASKLASLLDWTRPPGINDVVQHLHHYADLYNEGSIIIEKNVDV